MCFLLHGAWRHQKIHGKYNVPEDLKIIDLSMDYRIKATTMTSSTAFPKTEPPYHLHGKACCQPGCFATCIQLGLLPLAKHLMLNGDIMVNTITGSTGAGVKPSYEPLQLAQQQPECVQGFRAPALPEIKQSLKQLQNSFDSDIDFIPYRGDFPAASLPLS